MNAVKIKYGATQVKDNDGNIKWAPAMKFGNGGWCVMSHQGQTPLYDTEQEAEQYFED